MDNRKWIFGNVHKTGSNRVDPAVEPVDPVTRPGRSQTRVSKHWFLVRGGATEGARWARAPPKLSGVVYFLRDSRDYRHFAPSIISVLMIW